VNTRLAGFIVTVVGGLLLAAWKLVIFGTLKVSTVADCVSLLCYRAAAGSPFDLKSPRLYGWGLFLFMGSTSIKYL
jgi:hypothetical protein